VRNPAEAFNAHIDAPVEPELVKLQAENEARFEQEKNKPQNEKKADHEARDFRAE
jgi:hypothetical protein